MNSLILHAATRVLVPLMLLFSLFILLVGHNGPGGGFVGGLVAASAFSLYGLAHDAQRAQALLGVDGHTLVAWGLAVALGSALIGMASGLPFFTGVWTSVELPILGELALGTPLLFDLGVYLVVAGVGLLMILTLLDE